MLESGTAEQDAHQRDHDGGAVVNQTVNAGLQAAL